MTALYRWALVAYPRAFRREFGEAMLDLYAAQADRARRLGAVAQVRFLRFTLVDLVRNAVAERTRRWRRHPLTDRPQLPPESPRDPRESMNNLLREVRHAARRLMKAPAFTVTAVLIVALGIGANTAIFSFVDGVVLRPQPYADADRIVNVYQDSDDGEPNSNSFPAFRDIKATTSVFSDAVGVMPFGVTLLEEDGARPLATEWVTSNYFQMLGLRPFVGRDFTPADQVDGGEPVAIVAYGSWQTLFGADPDIVGRRINIDGTQVTVVGVAPRDYGGILPGFRAEIWMGLAGLRPIFGDYVANTRDNRGDHWFQVKARLQPDVTPEQSQAAMTALADRLATEFPEFNQGRRMTVFAPDQVRLHPSFDSQLVPMSVGLMGIVGLVLLIACSNLANLLLLRSAARSKDISVRMALGASRGQVFTHVLSESVLLSLTGGAVGLLLARWAIGAFTAAELPLGLPAAPDLRVDPRMMLFSAGLALATGVIFGLIPAWRLSRSDVVSSIRENVTPIALGRGRFTLRNALVVGQVALSFVLLVVAGLFVRSLGAASNADLGVDTSRIAAIAADLGHAGYDTESAGPAWEQLRQRIEASPAVESAALTLALPAGGGGSSTLIVDGYVDPDGTEAVEVDRSVVGPGYFRTLGIPLLHGRAFTTDDEIGRTAVISESMARAYFGDVDAVGGRFRGQGSDENAWTDVGGVVGDVRTSSATEPAGPVFYYTTGTGFGTQAYIVARTTADPEGVLLSMRDELRAIEASVPILRLTTMEGFVAESLQMERFTARLLSGFGILGLTLAALGMYAVVGFAVQRRTAELGIRMALGAARGQVIRMVIREVMTLIVIALGLGLLGAMLITPGISSVLFGVSPTDPVTLMATSLLLAATAALATWLPARRAAGVSPVQALRAK
ncbi:MAG: FtsX-like permease family protein [Acidobacteria bacterium]|nr:FtsX-like permease family protein [Acidobacteriota bacterium]